MNHGPGVMADPSAHEKWGGRKAREYVELTMSTYGWVCWLCGLPIALGKESADHVIAVDNGGAVYDIRNLGPAHRSCNFSRGKRDHAGPAALIEDGLAYFTTTTGPSA